MRETRVWELRRSSWKASRHEDFSKMRQREKEKETKDQVECQLTAPKFADANKGQETREKIRGDSSYYHAAELEEHDLHPAQITTLVPGCLPGRFLALKLRNMCRRVTEEGY